MGATVRDDRSPYWVDEFATRATPRSPNVQAPPVRAGQTGEFGQPRPLER
jgi:hypothetical protein